MPQPAWSPPASTPARICWCSAPAPETVSAARSSTASGSSASPKRRARSCSSRTSRLALADPATAAAEPSGAPPLASRCLAQPYPCAGMGYVPEQGVLERYARLLVEFALGNGAGIEPGDVVQVNGTDACKPLYIESCMAVWRAGGHVIHAYMPSEDDYGDVRRAFYELASDEQLSYLPATYARGVVDQVDHDLVLYAPANPRSLDGIDPARQMQREQSRLTVRQW